MRQRDKFSRRLVGPESFPRKHGAEQKSLTWNPIRCEGVLVLHSVFLRGEKLTLAQHPPTTR
jgi:hypothetical protein